MNTQQYLICDCVGGAHLEIMANEGVGASSGPIRFRGKFQEANIQNKNKRIYSYNILERERARMDSIIAERRLFGELDHPDNSVIHLENASHLITKLWWENSVLMGEGEILPTPAGRIFENLVRVGIPVGISSRGVGTGKTDANGLMVIEDSFRLITFDIVADPSTPGAFGNQMESRQPYYQYKTQPVANPAKKIEKNENKCIDTNNKINDRVIISVLKNIFEESVNKF